MEKRMVSLFIVTIKKEFGGKEDLMTPFVVFDSLLLSNYSALLLIC
ncbi:hypothetical protein [Bacillus alveayuensis]|nr:hypothetical protein [Bacillus alveayuensis]